MVDRRRAFTPNFRAGPLSEILTIANLRQAASRISTRAEYEFRLCLMKLCSSDNHYTTAILRPLRAIKSYIKNYIKTTLEALCMPKKTSLVSREG